MSLYFCVDAGGSRSRARVLDEQGGRHAEAVSGPCNPATSFDQAVASLHDVWRQCAALLGRRTDETDDVVFAIGAAGMYLDGRDRFLAACPAFRRAAAMSDGYAALIGAGMGEPCSLIIIGTGVAGHRLYPSGFSIQRDAWGWIAGDRGGGSWLGRKALRHFFTALDGVGAADALTRAVDGVIGGVEAIRTGWMRDLGPAKLAALAPVVLAQADAGDPAAISIRDRALDHLAALIGVIADDSGPLYAAGGLVPALRGRLAQRVGRQVLEPEGDALKGCWLVASGQAPEERALLFGESVEPSS
jgi:glucosamine kinase